MSSWSLLKRRLLIFHGFRGHMNLCATAMCVCVCVEKKTMALSPRLFWNAWTSDRKAEENHKLGTCPIIIDSPWNRSKNNKLSTTTTKNIKSNGWNKTKSPLFFIRSDREMSWKCVGSSIYGTPRSPLTAVAICIIVNSILDRVERMCD